MIESLPAYVSLVFILTTFAAIAFLLQSIKYVGLEKLPSQLLVFLIPLWLFFQAIVALGGFYQQTDLFPPRLVVYGLLPPVILILLYFVSFRESFIDRLPIRVLTLVHVVRVPVEIVLLWLYMGDMVPRIMTFDGWNFDVISGMLSPIVYLLAFDRGTIRRRWLLLIYTLIGILLLANIVIIAVWSMPSGFMGSQLDVPNRAVLFFPYVWLPTIIVPIVLFSHLASLFKILRNRDD